MLGILKQELRMLHEAIQVKTIARVPVWVNPNSGDITDIIKEDKYKGVRLLQAGKKLYAWPADKADHPTMAKRLGVPEESIIGGGVYENSQKEYLGDRDVLDPAPSILTELKGLYNRLRNILPNGTRFESVAHGMFGTL